MPDSAMALTPINFANSRLFIVFSSFAATMADNCTPGPSSHH
jgi:hypothetical protein